tara:strand:+ start:64 stop:408 length:345 start_codon:yes stop_codon:yes gene_type:complete
MDKTNQKRKHYKNNKSSKENKERKPMTEQSYRFRRVLGEILKYLKTLPHQSTFSKCQKEYGEQLTELIQKGYTWGYSYPIPVHEADYRALQKKEWAAIRAIVRKQEYEGPLANY